MEGSKARVRRRWIVIGMVLACIAVWLLTSPKRDLEVALGAKRLPASLKQAKVRVDSWQDYSVHAFFEVAPEDMRGLLALRAYGEVKVPGTLRLEIEDFRPPLPASFFPEVPRFEVEHLFEWQTDPDDLPRCQIWVSGDFSKAYLFYAAG